MPDVGLRAHDLAAAWPGAEPHGDLVVEGVVVDPATPLTGCGLSRGATVGVGGPRTRPDAELLVVAGPLPPDSTRLVGPVLVGSGAGCTLRLDHPSVDRAHALLEPGPGGWRVSPLSATHPTTVDGDPVTAVRTLPPGAVLGLGAIDLQVVAPVARPPAPDPTVPVHRAARSRGVREPDPGPVPERRQTPPAPVPPGVLSLVLPVAVGGFLAVAVHPTAGLFTAATPLLAIGAHLDARRRWRRDGRRDHAAHTEELNAHRRSRVAFERADALDRRREHPSPADATHRACLGTDLWTVRAGDENAGDVAVGWIDAGGRVPATVTLTDGDHLGIAGPRPWAEAVARAVVMGCLTRCGPHELGLADPDTDRWPFLRWLPHKDGDGPPLTLDPGRDGRPTAFGIEVADRLDALTDRCRAIVCWSPLGGLLAGPDAQARPTAIRPFLAAVPVAEGWARAMARWTDPDHGPGLGDPSLPGAVSLTALLEAVGDERPPDGSHTLATPLGIGPTGVVSVDLVAEGPHALVAGTTGAGKSELLRTWVATLAWIHPPSRVAFVLVDYKGGSAFDACARLPHVAGVVTDLDAGLGERLLVGLRAEVRDREATLRAAGAGDLGHLAAGPPRLVVMVDEFATLAAELPEFLGALVDVARRGRSLGVHLVLATQRPAGAVNDDIRANTALRLCLRTLDAADSQDVIGGPEAAALPVGRPGRAWLRNGDGLHQLQVASSFDPERDPTRRALSIRRVGEPWADEAGTGRTELESLVAGATHRWAEEPGVEPVWRPPLPERLPLGLRHGASWVVLGREDRPAERRQPDLIWDPADGHLVVLGGRGRGRTTTLRTALLALATQRPPDALEIHVVAPRGPLTELGVLPHSGAMVDLQDRLTVRRLVRRLEARSADAEAPPCAPLTILAVDGYEALAAGLDDLEGLRLLDELDHLARDGARRGIILALTSSRPSVVPASLAAATGRLVALGLDDPADYGLLGLRPRPGPLPPGRGQTAAGHEVQIGCPDLSPAEVVACHPAARPRGRPSPVAGLPEHIALTALGPAPGRVRIGLRDRDLRVATVELRADTPFVVVGPPRSGRSGALALLWAQRPDRPCTRHRAGDDPALLYRVVRSWLARPTPHLFVVDEAERIDDPHDDLLTLVRRRHPDALVAVAVRSDAWQSGYGRWVDELRPANHGLALRPDPVRDTESWACPLPSVGPSPPPGRGVLVADGTAEVVQVAGPDD